MGVGNKLIFAGSPDSEKTVLKNMFIDIANPLQLLETPPKPTRGINSRLYSLFDLKFGVFDLAGHENQDWFNKVKKIFSDAQLIISVVDFNSYLKDIFMFFEDFINILNILNLSDCCVATFLHKIDLIDS